VIAFGSVARGEDGPDSDLDLMVVLDRVEAAQRLDLMSKLRRCVTAPVPVDVMVTDPEEIERRKDVPGSAHYWPLREGKVVYDRAA
jgi:predicted nucleotidyltransferase